MTIFGKSCDLKACDLCNTNTVEPRYFEPSGEAKNSSKYQEFKIANSK